MIESELKMRKRVLTILKVYGIPEEEQDDKRKPSLRGRILLL